MLDVLYNNAAVGLIGQDNRVTRLPEEIWERVLRINLTSVYLCCKYGIPHMAESGGGSIINTASINGLVGNQARDVHQSEHPGRRRGGLPAQVLLDAQVGNFAADPYFSYWVW